MVSEITYLRRYRQPLVAGMPEDVADELDHAFHRAFPHGLWVEGSERTLLRYAISPKSHIDFYDGIEIRELVGWLCIKTRRIGMVKLREWHFPPFPRDSKFFDDADALSKGASDFAAAVLSAWPVARLTVYGSLLEVDRVWMAPGHGRGSLWAGAINGLIQRRYRRGYAALLLNTWPADYKADSIDVDGWQGKQRWDRRRTALARLAQRTLGVRPLSPGCPEHDAWWLWRPLTVGVPAPRKRRLSWL